MESHVSDLDWLPSSHSVSEWSSWAEGHLHLDTGASEGHFFSFPTIVNHGRVIEWVMLAVICLLALLRWRIGNTNGPVQHLLLHRKVKPAQSAPLAANGSCKLSLLANARHIHPKGENKRRIKMAKFWVRGCIHHAELERLWHVVGAPVLAPLLKADPGILEKPLRPYMHAHASLAERVTLLRQHYAFLRKCDIDIISRLFTPEGILLGRYPVTDEAPCQIVLRHDVTFRREGELSLSLLNESGQRLYSCAFNITQHSNAPALVIGSVQGPEPSVVEPMAVIQRMTKQAFGVRPKSLVVMLLFMLAEGWKIEQVFAIPKAAHVFQARRYRNRNGKEMHADYDELWREFGATPIADCLWRLAPYQRKPLEEIASKKRSMYRQRYAWLDELALRVREQLAESGEQTREN